MKELCRITLCTVKEFEGASWEDVVAHNDDNQLWQDDWEDDDLNDDFTQQLRVQLESSSQTTTTVGNGGP